MKKWERFLLLSMCVFNAILLLDKIDFNFDMPIIAQDNKDVVDETGRFDMTVRAMRANEIVAVKIKANDFNTRGYNLLQLQFNTLDLLARKGIIHFSEGQKVLDNSQNEFFKVPKGGENE